MSCKRIDIAEYRRVLVGILKEIDSFCRENEIKYFLTAGTLIGAIRHKGFIPWDDDIDISLFREDYEFFIRNFKPSNNYSVLSLETDRHYNYPFAKVVDKRMGLKENAPGSVEIGPYVDVFPIDNFPDGSLEDAKKLFNKIQFLKKIRDFKIIRLSKNRKFYKNVLLFLGKALTVFISRRHIAKRLSKVAQRYRFEKSKYVGTVVELAYGYGGILKREYFQQTIELEFEKQLFLAPVGYHEILTALYGDYMQLPPIEKRKSNHDFECWYKE